MGSNSLKQQKEKLLPAGKWEEAWLQQMLSDGFLLLCIFQLQFAYFFKKNVANHLKAKDINLLLNK